MICKKLVGLLGPYEMIRVESAVDCGSKFTFVMYSCMNETQLSNQSICNSRYISVMRESPQKMKGIQ